MSDPATSPSRRHEADLYPIPTVAAHSDQTDADEHVRALLRRSPSLPAIMSGLRPFQDVRICGLLKRRCYVTKPPVVRVYLELSAHPPLGWSYVFMMAWHARADPKAEVGLDEDSLWIECQPADLKGEHLPLLQETVGAANSRYRSMMEEQLRARTRQERLGREALEIIRRLDLELRPRPEQPKRSRHVLRAYLRPASLGALWVVLFLGGVAGLAVVREKLGVLGLMGLAVLWVLVLCFIAMRAVSRFSQVFNIRRLAFKEQARTKWPARYVDREGRMG